MWEKCLRRRRGMPAPGQRGTAAVRKKSRSGLPAAASGVRWKRSVLITVLLGVLWSTPALAASSPLISGTETAEDADPAQGPALEDGTADGAEGSSAASGAGDSAEVSYTQEQLDDNYIEYGELEALVRQGNVTAVSAENAYQTNLAIYQEAYNTMVAGIGDMNSRADELEENDGDAALIAIYEQNAEILSASAKQYRNSITSLNSQSSQASRNRTVWGQVKLAQSMMGTCAQMDAQVQTVEKRVEASQAAYDRKVSERVAGLCTDQDLLEAEEALLSAQTALLQTQSQAASARRQLGILIGKSGADLQLGEVPPVTEEELSAMDLEVDRAMAVIADSTVKSLRSTSASGDAERRSRSNRLEDARGSASISADEQYREVASLRLTRDAARSAWEAAQKDYSALQIKYQSGAINKSTYLNGETTYYQARAAYVSAEASLREAYDAYQWMLKGV